MGFAYLILFAVALGLSGILLIVWIVTKRKLYGILLGIVVFSFVLFIIADLAMPNFNFLKKDDYYGTYVVKRDFYKGAQADWQYNSFRFEIRSDDSIFFYYTNKQYIIKTYKGVIETTIPYASARLIVKMEQPVHHILTSNPTTVRTGNRFYKRFYMVFNSPRFKNVFFKKGEWRPIE